MSPAQPAEVLMFFRLVLIACSLISLWLFPVVRAQQQADGLPSGKLVSGTFHNCALVAGGEVRCWGDGKYGQLGNGKTVNAALPQKVLGLSGVKQLLAGNEWNCALSAGGDVACWGRLTGALLDPTGKQQLRSCKAYNGPAEACLPVPAKIAGLKNIVRLGGGGTQAFAQDATGHVWGWHLSWATPSLVQMRDLPPFASLSNQASEVSGGDPAQRASIAGTWSAGCALLPDGHARCWGSPALLGQRAPLCQVPEPSCQFHFQGQSLGIRETDQSNVGFCAARDQLGPEACTPMRYVCQNQQCTYVEAPLNQATHLQCVAERPGQSPDYQIFYPALIRPSAQDPANCQPPTLAQAALTPVEGIDGLVQLSASWHDNVFGIRADHSVWFWGTHRYIWELASVSRTAKGQVSALRPQEVPELKGAVQVAENRHHGCALMPEGQVRCWGEQSFDGILGNPAPKEFSDRPVPVLNLPPALEIRLGWSHTCALLKDHQVACWGNNDTGQLGSATLPRSLRPITVPGLLVR